MDADEDNQPTEDDVHGVTLEESLQLDEGAVPDNTEVTAEETEVETEVEEEVVKEDGEVVIEDNLQQDADSGDVEPEPGTTEDNMETENGDEEQPMEDSVDVVEESESKVDDVKMEEPTTTEDNEDVTNTVAETIADEAIKEEEDEEAQSKPLDKPEVTNPESSKQPQDPESPDLFSAFYGQEESKSKPDTGAKQVAPPPPPPSSKKYKKSYPHYARDLREDLIQNAMRKTPAPHEYFGWIFSADCKRPPSYYKNYFLPQQHQPLLKQHVKIVGKSIPPEALGHASNAPLHALPLSTVKVRWLLHRRRTVYRAKDVYAILGRFGPIDCVHQVSNNSALVVFKDIEAAHEAVKTPGLGYPWDTLIADFVEPRLNNHGYYQKYADIEQSPFKVNIPA